MNGPHAPVAANDAFAPEAPRGGQEPATLILDIDGFEGPLDLLLSLAQSQKVDLRRISVSELAGQYLDFINHATRLRLELAADYLVMAAWLAYLKSRLLLPAPPPDDEPSAEDMAARLTLRLARLEAMRAAAARLMAQNRLGVDVFPRGAPEGITSGRSVVHEASLVDLLRAYARIRTRDAFRPLVYEREPVFTMDDALERLSRLIGPGPDWRDLIAYLPPGWQATPLARRSAVAANLTAALELARRGAVELRQEAGFAPIHIRRKPT